VRAIEGEREWVALVKLAVGVNEIDWVRLLMLKESDNEIEDELVTWDIAIETKLKRRKAKRMILFMVTENIKYLTKTKIKGDRREGRLFFRRRRREMPPSAV